MISEEVALYLQNKKGGDEDKTTWWRCLQSERKRRELALLGKCISGL